MADPKFQIFRSSTNQQYYFRLRASNSEIILNSEGYITMDNCRSGVESVKNNAPYESRYERNYNAGSYTFNLKASNGQIIGRSESYTTSAARDNGIAAVKMDAPVASIEYI